MPTADAELEAKIVPDESAIEEVEERELELGGGGELSSSQENKRQGIISGGFRTALAATGLLGLLASLKPLTATVSAILGEIGRSLVPVIETIAELLRPFADFANSIGQATANVNVRRNLEESIFEDPFGTEFTEAERETSIGSLRRFRQQRGTTLSEVGDQALTGLIDILSNVTDGGAGSPDQSDEAKKQDSVNRFRDSQQDKLGATE